MAAYFGGFFGGSLFDICELLPLLTDSYSSKSPKPTLLKSSFLGLYFVILTASFFCNFFYSIRSLAR